MIEIIPDRIQYKGIYSGSTVRISFNKKPAIVYDLMQWNRNKLPEIKDYLLHLAFGYMRNDVEKMLCKMLKCNIEELNQMNFLILELKKA